MMKGIPKSDFIEISKRLRGQNVFEDEIQPIFDKLGDDWFIDRSRGGFVRVNENKNREEFLRDNNEKKYKCHLSLNAEDITTGTMMLTKEEYEIVKRVTDLSNWDDVEWNDWCGSFSVNMEGEE